MPPKTPFRISQEDWLKEAERRYGARLRKIRVTCPACGHVQSGEDFVQVMSPEQAASRLAFSCIGRWLPESRNAFSGQGAGPCNYTNGGLFVLGPVFVV